MSAWMEVHSLRVPCSELGIDGDAWDFCQAHENETEFDWGEYPDWNFPHFAAAPTEGDFLDLVLSEEVTDRYGSWGSTREPDAEEREKYLPVFTQYFPQLDTSRIRHVHYVYYDGTEAPDYYE